MSEANEPLWGIWCISKKEWVLDSASHPRWLSSKSYAETFKARFHRSEDFEVRALPVDFVPRSY